MNQKGFENKNLKEETLLENEDFKKIADKGVKITAQLTPSDDSHDFMKLMNEKIK